MSEFVNIRYTGPKKKKSITIEGKTFVFSNENNMTLKIQKNHPTILRELSPEYAFLMHKDRLGLFVDASKVTTPIDPFSLEVTNNVKLKDPPKKKRRSKRSKKK